MRKNITYVLMLLILVIGVALALAGEVYLGSAVAIVGAAGAYICARADLGSNDHP